MRIPRTEWLRRQVLAVCFAGIAASQVPTFHLETLTGADMPAAVPALEWNFSNTLYAMTLDPDGNLWFIEGSSLRKLTRDGQLQNVPLQLGLSPGCSFREARLDPFYSLAIGPDRLLYLFDPYCRMLRRIHPDGTNEAIAGQMIPGVSGNGGPALQATLASVQSMAFDTVGNLFLLERDTLLVRKIDRQGIITQYANLANVLQAQPWGIAVDPQGNIFVSEHFAPFRILKITPLGVASVYAAANNFGLWLAFDGAGNLYAGGGYQTPVTRITPDQKLEAIPNTENYAGGFAVDSRGNVFFADTVASISVTGPSGAIRRVAGTGKTAAQAGNVKYAPLPSSVTNNSVAVPNGAGMWIGRSDGLYLLTPEATLQRMVSIPSYFIAFDSEASLYHLSNPSNSLEMWKLDGNQNGARVRAGPDVRPFGITTSLAVDSRDNVYTAHYNPDSGGRVLRLDKQTGQMFGIAGTGEAGDSGDGGPATSARLQRPGGLGTDLAGSVYIADYLAARVRKVTLGGTISTFAGTGVGGEGAEGALAVASSLVSPGSVTADVLGNVYIAEWGTVTHRIRMVDRSGIIRTIAGGQQNTRNEDGTPGGSAKLDGPSGLVVGRDGVLYFLDGRAIRRLVPDTTEFPRSSLAGVAHGATFETGPISPGMVLTIFGTNLGAPGLIQARATGGKFPISAGNTVVTFDDVPAPMLYASPGQIAVMVPYFLTPGKKTRIVIGVSEARSLPLEVDVVAARPGLFTANSSGKGPGAILNQNNTVNSATNPADPGSIVAVYGTGAGQSNPAGIDGLLANSATLPKPLLPVTVKICGAQAEVLYAGAAPQLVAGVLQVNARVPAGCRGLSEVRLSVGTTESPAGVTLFVRN